MECHFGKLSLRRYYNHFIRKKEDMCLPILDRYSSYLVALYASRTLKLDFDMLTCRYITKLFPPVKLNLRDGLFVQSNLFKFYFRLWRKQ